MENSPLYAFFGGERLLVFAHDYTPGSVQDWHHHDVPQLLHAARGVMRMSTPNGYWVIPPGRGVWIPAFLPHEVQMVGSVSMRTLYVGCPMEHEFAAECAVVDVPPMLRHLLEALAGAEPPAPEYRRRRKVIEDLVLIEIEGLNRLRLHVPLPADERLRRLCDEMLAAPDANRTLDDLAAAAGASGRTLRRIFQQELGMSFAAWREQALIVEALARLEEGRPATTVARELGYAAPGAFTAMFKRVLGRPPREHQSRRRTEVANPARQFDAAGDAQHAW